MDKNETCPSCGHELEPGLNECPGCGGMTPPRVLLDPNSLVRQAGRILLLIAVGMLLKMCMIG